jgi:tetratricopeptide (TPR) repeat protein
MRVSRRAIWLSVAFLAYSAAARAEWTEDAQRCYRSTGDIALNIQYCTRAIESGRLTNSELSTTHSNRGGQYEARGEYEMALSDYNAAVRLSPENAAGYVRRGSYYQRHGEHSKARAEFDKAISIPVRPDNEVDYLQRARAQRAKGDLTAALADLEQGARINAGMRELHTERAGI